MEKICSNCNEPLDNAADTCPSCGVPAPQNETDNEVDEIVLYAESSDKVTAPLPDEKTLRDELVEESKKNMKKEKKKTSDAPTDKRYKTVGMFKYLLFLFLFCIPFVGFVLAIVMAFAPKNKSFKNFSRAAIIWLAIMIAFGTVVSSIGGVLVLALGVVVAGAGGSLIAAASVAAGLLAGENVDVGELIRIGEELFGEVLVTAGEIIEIILDLGEFIDNYNSGEYDQYIEGGNELEQIIGGAQENDQMILVPSN